MKKSTRYLSLVLAIAAMGGSLSGCGKKQTTSQLSENGEFIPGDKIELTVWETQGTDYSPTQVEEGDVVAGWLENKTKVTVKNMYGNDGGQWDSKLTKLVAGNNLPDIIHCGAYQGPAHFAKLAQLGQVWELTPELLQTYAPEVWKRTPAEYWDEIKVDGKIYGIPYNAPSSDAVFSYSDEEEVRFIQNMTELNETDVTYLPGQTFWIRDDILKEFYPNARSYDDLVKLLEEKQEPIGDELLDIPIRSTDEFIDFMYKIKEKGFTADGKNVYAFGYNGGDNWIALSWLGADMYGYKNHNYTGTWNEKKQQIEIPLVHDMIRQAAREQNQMLRDKVIDPESLAHTVAQYKEKVLNGQYAIVPLSAIDNAYTINQELEKNGKTFRFRPFITQVPEQPDYPAYKEKQLWTESLCLLKTLSEDEMHQVLNWINTQYTEEYDKIRNWGPEEAGLYKETEDGKRVFTDDRFYQCFVEGQNTLPNPGDTKGLGGKGGLMSVLPTAIDHWNPQVVYKKANYVPDSYSGFKFKSDSEHVKNVKIFPPAQVWASVYAEIPEVVDFWSTRERWENKFKIAMAASSTEEFEEKWDSAITDLNNIVSIDNLEKAMTEVAKPLAEEISKQ